MKVRMLQLDPINHSPQMIGINQNPEKRSSIDLSCNAASRLSLLNDVVNLTRASIDVRPIVSTGELSENLIYASNRSISESH